MVTRRNSTEQSRQNSLFILVGAINWADGSLKNFSEVVNGLDCHLYYAQLVVCLGLMLLRILLVAATHSSIHLLQVHRHARLYSVWGYVVIDRYNYSFEER